MNGTYKELLEMLGISHTMFILVLILAFFLFSIFMFFYKLGFLTPIRFKHITLPKSKIVFTSYQGSYDVINTKVQEVLTESNQIFKVSNLFGIYYDVEDEKDLDQQRAILGLMVAPIEEEKISLLMEKFPAKYKQSQIPTSVCVGTKYPYFNSVSLIMIVNRVYPRLAEFMKEKKIQGGPGILEVYKILDKSPHVQILVPLQNMDKFKF